ncbi:MAG: GFA family protein [Parvularculaceae bacterium]|nr:GFA family protein [Parvularculaceae bacterium]
MTESFTAEGGCDCGDVRYRMKDRPLFVHCCHCRWCQRESGAAFALNAMIESELVETIAGAPELVLTPSASGKGQKIARCPSCRIALWSHYAGAGEKVKFMRVGALDNPALAPPDIHIFTASKQPWVIIPPRALSVEEFYDWREVWPQYAKVRRAAISQ